MNNDPAKTEPTEWDKLIESTDKMLSDPAFDVLEDDPIFDELQEPKHAR